MKKRILFPIVIGTILATTMGVFAANSSENASIGITPGTLSVSLPASAIQLSEISLTGSSQTVTANIPNPITVTDSTGLGEGWTLQVTASQMTEVAPSSGFAAGTSALTLPKGSLGLAPPSNIQAVGTTSPLPTNDMQSQTIIDNGSSITVVSAGSKAGMGEYQISFPTNALSFTVSPATTYVDTTNYPNSPTPYESSVVWQVNAGPAGSSTTSTASTSTSVQPIVLQAGTTISPMNYPAQLYYQSGSTYIPSNSKSVPTGYYTSDPTTYFGPPVMETSSSYYGITTDVWVTVPSGHSTTLTIYGGSYEDHGYGKFVVDGNTVAQNALFYNGYNGGSFNIYTMTLSSGTHEIQETQLDELDTWQSPNDYRQSFGYQLQTN